MGATLNGAEMDEIERFTRSRAEEYSKNETISLKNRDEQTLFCVRSGLIYLCAENEVFSRALFGEGYLYTKGAVL